jgi:hypothetical protein
MSINITKLSIINLNLDILNIITQYTCLNALLETTSVFNIISKNLRIVNLQPDDVYQYINNNNFKKMINSLILSTKQLSINITNISEYEIMNYFDFFSNISIKKISLRNSSFVMDISLFQNIHTVDLRCSNIKYFGKMYNINTLILCHCNIFSKNFSIAAFHNKFANVCIKINKYCNKHMHYKKLYNIKSGNIIHDIYVCESGSGGCSLYDHEHFSTNIHGTLFFDSESYKKLFY